LYLVPIYGSRDTAQVSREIAMRRTVPKFEDISKIENKIVRMMLALY